MEKIIKDGKVAVAVSFGFGCGWSSEIGADINPMDARFNKLFIEGNLEEVTKFCEEEGIGWLAEGAKDVRIVWIEEGAVFVITADDQDNGSEDIIIKGDRGWHIA